MEVSERKFSFYYYSTMEKHKLKSLNFWAAHYLILQALKGRKIFLIIDETGDKKKGKRTDYVKRQYLGKLGKIDNGIVAVTAWG